MIKEVSKKEEPSSSSSKKGAFNFSLEEMAEAGLHFGHRTSQTNPKMKPFIFGARNGVHIIDLEKTAESLKTALKFVEKIISEKGLVLFVGTKIQVKDFLKQTAIDCEMPYISERWLGGTFTNFETLTKRINHFKDLEQKRASGELEKYTKKERSLFDKEIADLEIKFGGIKNMIKMPEAVFIFDLKKDIIAVKEAKKRGVKIIGIAHTNADPNWADYPIPANDDSSNSVKYILEKTKQVILGAK